MEVSHEQEVYHTAAHPVSVRTTRQTVAEGDTFTDPCYQPARKRVDDEYERAGTANISMFAEPLAGWRELTVSETKTKVDWAIEMASLMQGRYAKAEHGGVVSDNLNTHERRLYESFVPARAAFGPSHRLLHTQVRKLAEHCRERTE